MKTADAYNHLAGAILADPSYAITWQANIAMPIFDGCAKRNIPMTHAQANELADDLMAHLWRVAPGKVRAAPGVAGEV